MSTMFSIPKRVMVLCGGVVAAAVMGGCQANVPNSTERLNNSPLIVDEAMQAREWDRSTAFYANGDTVSGGTGYMFHTHETIPDGYRRVIEPGVAAMNIGLLPVGVFVNTPFKPQVQQGAIIPPTHSAMPPLP
jgi:hypothetical protein